MESAIAGVLLKDLDRHDDRRGWLTELYREDALDEAGIGQARPVMAYLSMTRPGVARGPHEHIEQTDFFAFIGPSDFEVLLWDNREGAKVRCERFVLGASRPATLIVPPRVVHAYRNIGAVDGWVLNFPNRLYRGAGRRSDVDEVRHEDDPDSRFTLPEAPKEVVPGCRSPQGGDEDPGVRS